MKRIPRKFDLMLSEWKVIEAPSAIVTEEDGSEEEVLGVCYSDFAHIVLGKTLSGQKLDTKKRYETLWHEIVHAIDFALHHDPEDRWSHSEVDRLGRILAQIVWTME